MLGEVDLYAISKFLGRANLEQTKVYAHLAVNPFRRVQRKPDLKLFEKFCGAKMAQIENA